MYGLDYRQYRKFVVVPTLQRIGLWSQAAENLVLGTCLVESRLTYIDQVDKADKPGPAFGFPQMEGPTHYDLYRAGPLKTDQVLRRKVLELASFFSSEIPDPREMSWNMCYAVAMCRVFYRRIVAALPAADDAQALADYHKKYYNTYLGKTKVSESVEHFKFVVEKAKEKI